MKCVVFGQSHSLAMTMAAREAASISQTQTDVAFAFIRVEPSQTPDVPEIMGRLNAELLRETQPTLIAAILGGNEHNVHGLLARWPPYDVVSPGLDLPFNDAAVAVPYEAMRRILKDSMQPWLAILAETARLPHPVVFVQPPRPIASADHVVSHLDPGFGAVTGPEAIAPAALRLKLWSCMDEITREECARLGVPHLAAPAQTVDANGFLAREAWWVDATHANAWYGEQWLRRLHAYAVVALAPPAATRVAG